MTSCRTVLGKWSKLNWALPEFKSPMSAVWISLFFFLLRSSLLYGKTVEVNWIHRTWNVWQGDWGRATASNCCHLFCPHKSHSLLLANKSHTAERPRSLPFGSSAEEWSEFFFFNYWKATSGKQVADKWEPLQTSCYEMPRLHFFTLSLFLFANPA